MKRIKLFENFESKDDIIEKIKSLEYILKDENLKVGKYGSRHDTHDRITIFITTLSEDVEWNKLIQEDFLFEYVDRVEQIFIGSKFLKNILIRINGNLFITIDKDGQKIGTAFRDFFKDLESNL